jgi:octaprenyl-diphosphate synthase
VEILVRHGTLESTRATALDWSARARAALADLPEHPLREMLADLSDYVVARVS